MTEAIGQILGDAVGVAISPVPIIALILMLFSAAAGRNSLAFLAGWLIGLSAVGIVALALGIGSGSDSDSGGIAKIAIGVLFVALGVRQWRGRPRAGEQAKMPAWMATVDHLGAIKAFGLGLLLTILNPKNAGLTIAAAASIASSGLSNGEEAATLAVFVLLASVTIILPVAFYLLARERSRSVLDSLKGWLIQNNNTVMTVLFIVLGAKVLGDGLSGIG